MLNKIIETDTGCFNAAPKKYGQTIRPNTALQKGSPVEPIVNSQPINQIKPKHVPLSVDLPHLVSLLNMVLIITL
jgi:hypothetical protein